MIALAGLVSLFLLVDKKPAQGKGTRGHRTGAGNREAKRKKPDPAISRGDDLSLPQPEESASNNALLELARTAVRRSPADAFAWAQAQRDAGMRERQYFAVLRAWDELNAAAPVWFNPLPADPEFDKAIAQLVTATNSVKRSPEVAISWVAGITDPELRRGSLRHVMHEWTKTDSTAAWRCFDDLFWFTESDRESLRKEIEAMDSVVALSD